MTFSSISPNQLRRIILEQSKRANVGHIGSALSVADIVTVLYGDVLNLSDLNDPNRDRCIISKGHAALAIYGALHLLGLLSKTDLESFCVDGGLLGVHPDHAIAGIDFTTGSLGHGLSIGAGAALAARLQQSRRSVFVLMSDAECNEGSIWEAAMFAAHHRLDNLVAIVDHNGQQAFGYTEQVLSSPLKQYWQAFKWDVVEVDGHNIEELKQTLADVRTHPGQPHLVLAHTTFGQGVSFMKSQIKWHYLPMNDSQYSQALAEIDELT